MSGFEGAPFSQSILVTSAAASIGAALLGKVPVHGWGLVSGLLARAEFWRIPSSMFVFTTPPEILFGLYFIWNFREFERRFGTIKFSSAVLFMMTFSSFLQIMSLYMFPGAITEFSSGPYALVFGMFPFFLSDIPSSTKFKLLSLPISDKAFAYLLAVQLMFAAYPSSVLTAVYGFIAGIAFRFRYLPFHRFRIPSTVFQICSSVLGTFLFNTSHLGLFSGPPPQRSPPRMRRAISRPFIVDEDAVRKLKDMGFPEDSARSALRASDNNIEAATNFLLG